jgi:hypothetical protein
MTGAFQMAERLTREIVAEKAIVHAELPLAAHPRHQIDVDRNFGLPIELYAMTALGYLGFLGLMAMMFGNPGLILPMAVFVVFLAMFFGVPAMWARMKPDHTDRPKSWSRFMAEGIQTYTGHCKGRDAAVQVVIMPALIFCWGIGVVTIAVLTR